MYILCRLVRSCALVLGAFLVSNILLAVVIGSAQFVFVWNASAVGTLKAYNFVRKKSFSCLNTNLKVYSSGDAIQIDATFFRNTNP